MKQKILLKSFFVIALIVIFGTEINASEITGDLSSSSTQSKIIGTSGASIESNGTIDNGIILAGNVEGGFTEGEYNTIDNGILAGNVDSDSTSTNNSHFSSDSTSLQPKSGNNFAFGITTNENIDGSVLGSETAEAATIVQNIEDLNLNESNNIFRSYWLWIILFLLVIITIIVYSNSGSKKTKEI